MDLKTFVSAVFMLTLVMDPMGNIPMFISALKEVPAERKRAVLARELLIALGIMLVIDGRRGNRFRARRSVDGQRGGWASGSEVVW